MRAKALLLFGSLMTAWTHALAQGSVPDMTKPNYAGRETGVWSQLLPPLLFFIGLALVAGMFLLGQAGRRRTPPPGGPPHPLPGRFPRPPFPPPPRPKP